MNFCKRISYLLIVSNFILNISSAQDIQSDPFEITFGNEAVIVGAGTVVGLAAILLTADNETLTENELDSLNKDDVNGFDRIAVGPYSEDNLGDFLLYSSFFLPVSFLANENAREDLPELAIMYGEVIMLNAGINGLVKALTLRNRPWVYDSNTTDEQKNKVDARHSFYSGHTSMAASNSFFTARVFSEYLTDHTAQVLVWSAAALIPAVTGYSRVITHNHFPTDVIVGYIVGAAIGYLIPELHNKEYQPGNSAMPAQFIHKPLIGFQFKF